jgi:hypothetical protein
MPDPADAPAPSSGGFTADELTFLRKEFRDVPWPRDLLDWIIVRKVGTGARAGHLRSAGAESLIARGLLAVEAETPQLVRVRPSRELVARLRRELATSWRAFPARSYSWLRGEIERLRDAAE